MTALLPTDRVKHCSGTSGMDPVRIRTSSGRNVYVQVITIATFALAARSSKASIGRLAAQYVHRRIWNLGVGGSCRLSARRVTRELRLRGILPGQHAPRTSPHSSPTLHFLPKDGNQLRWARVDVGRLCAPRRQLEPLLFADAGHHTRWRPTPTRTSMHSAKSADRASRRATSRIHASHSACATYGHGSTPRSRDPGYQDIVYLGAPRTYEVAGRVQM